MEEVTESGSVPNLAVTNKVRRSDLDPRRRNPHRSQAKSSHQRHRFGSEGREVRPTSQLRGSRPLAIQVSTFRVEVLPPLRRFARRRLRAVHRNRSENGVAASNQGEVWDEVRACLDGVGAKSETASLTDAFDSAEEKLREHCKRMVLPEGAAGILVGRDDRIIGMDLFDSAKTLKTLWDRLSDAYFFDALRDPKAAPPTSIDHAQRFIERLGSAAKPRVPALALGDELEITSEGLVGAALLYDGKVCHLAAFSDGE